MKRVVGIVLFVAVCAVAIGGCAKQGGSQRGLGGPQASDFPVYSPSTIVTTGKYDDSAAITTLGSAFFGTGADEYKPYIGVQELIKTSATLDELDAWLKKTVLAPPPDLYPSQNTADRYAGSPEPSSSGAPSASPSVAPSGTQVADPFVESFKMFGLLPAGFWTKDHGRVVMIIVLDPKQVADHLGPTMELMDQYDKLPGLVRGGIDETIKKNTGFSISDLTNTNTPMGMIVYAARNFKDGNTRAIILVDALRQPNALPTPHASGT